MFTTEQIHEIKKQHPESFAAKRAAGLDEQQTAAVITAQIENDTVNPPGLKQLAEVRSLISLVKARGAEFERLKQEAVRRAGELGDLAQDLDVGFTGTGAPQSERIAELESFLDATGAELAKTKSELDVKAKRIAQLEAGHDVLKNDLKAAQDALKNAPKKK